MPLLIFFKADIVANCIKLRKISYFQLFSAVFGPKIHDFLPHFARFKPDFHVPREILSYRKKKSCQSEQYYSSNGCFRIATVTGANWRVKLINYSSATIIMHEKWSSFRDCSMIMHEHLDMSQYQSKIVGQSSILALGDGLFWHCSGGVIEFEVNLDIFWPPLTGNKGNLDIFWPPLTRRSPPQCAVNKDQPLYGRNTKTAVKALMLFGLTCLIHQNALEFHEEHTGEAAHARGRLENVYIAWMKYFISVFLDFEGLPVSYVGWESRFW